jgi:hypothetical protein
MSIKKSLSLERSDVLHHGGLAGETEMTLDFARARRNAFLTLLVLNEIQNAPLPLR